MTQLSLRCGIARFMVWGSGPENPSGRPRFALISMTAPTARRRPVFVGIDISSATLEVAAPKIQAQVKNDTTGFRKLLSVTNRYKMRRHFVCEPTGSHTRELVKFLLLRNCRVSIVNPVRVRHFAGARGRFAKTDRLDAKIIAEYPVVVLNKAGEIVAEEAVVNKGEDLQFCVILEKFYLRYATMISC